MEKEIYIVHNNIVWTYHFLKKKIDKKPIDINHYIKGIDISNYNSFRVGYYDNMIYLADNLSLYSIELKTFNIINKELSYSNKIRAIINSLNGNLYIFGVSNVLEKNKDFVFFHQIYKKFPSIPLDSDTGFRYYDSFIYFIKDGIYYKYNDYKQKVVERGIFNFEFFGINCEKNKINNEIQLFIDENF